MSRDPLDELAESFLAEFREGRDPSITDFAARHPEYAADIRELFPALLMLSEVGAESSAERGKPET